MRFAIEIHQSQIDIVGDEVDQYHNLVIAEAETVSLRNVEFNGGRITAEITASWGLSVLIESLPNNIRRHLGTLSAFRVRRGMVKASWDGEHYVTEDGLRMSHAGVAVIERGVLTVGDFTGA